MKTVQWLCVLFCINAAIVSSWAAGTYYKVEYPPSTNDGELKLGVVYTMWLPDKVETLRGVIVHQHGASMPAMQAGATAAYDLRWQALAKKWDCALLGPSYKVLTDATDTSPGGAGLWSDPRLGSEKAFLKALADLGTQSNHPELQNAPWLLWGHSAGGVWSNTMAAMYPQRVAAMFLRSGTTAMVRTKTEFPQPVIPEALYAIPTMTNAGVGEKAKGPWPGSITTFQEYRAAGTPIGFAPDPITAHWCGDSRYLAIPFLDACMAMRLPDKGSKDQTLKPVDMSTAWLAPLLGDTAVPAKDFKTDATKAVWLPNEAVAQAWMQYVKTGTVADYTPPPSPFDVKANVTDKGVEITWDAEADFESGVGGFIVMRDARGLARLPEGPPPRVFGRPLFQGLSFHDTPEGPPPAMRFIDTTAKPGDKHVYTIIELNSAGIASPPSQAVTINAPTTTQQ